MILASAIKFYIDKTDEDVVLCGLRHGDIFRQLKALGFEPQKGYKEISQGFITDKGEFLDRKRALDHAMDCGQINSIGDLKYIREDKIELFSEDLW